MSTMSDQSVMLNEFLRQNTRAAATLRDRNPNDLLGYASNHAGGLVVFESPTPGGLHVKMHDSWGDPENAVVVHVYDPDDPDTHDYVSAYPTGAAALEHFEHVVNYEDLLACASCGHTVDEHGGTGPCLLDACQQFVDAPDDDEDDPELIEPLTVQAIKGTITLTDGTVSDFLILPESWSQWGADRARLGMTTGVLDSMAQGLSEDGMFTSDRSN